MFPAILLPALFYIIWDIFFTAKNVWSFNENYITGIKLINLPIEEVLFFFVVPYCCVFVYECIRCYFPKLESKPIGNSILQLLAVVLVVAGIIFYQKKYTSSTFMFTAIFIAVISLLKNYFKRFDATLFLVAFTVILIPFLLVNGFLTAIPVVMYNNAENLGIRIYTIPFEDVFYGMLLMLMNICIYEKLQKKYTPGVNAIN